MMTSVRKTHVVPTHVRTPETALTLGGISLSARQFLLLLVGAALSYDLWKHLTFLTTFFVGVVLAGAIAILPSVLALSLAFGQVAGRALDAWGLVIMRYFARPRHLIWCSVRFMETRVEEWEDRVA